MGGGGDGIAGNKIVLARAATGTGLLANKWLIPASSITGLRRLRAGGGRLASTWVAYGHAIASPRQVSGFRQGRNPGCRRGRGRNNATVIRTWCRRFLFSVPRGPAAALFPGAAVKASALSGSHGWCSENPDLMY